MSGPHGWWCGRKRFQAVYFLFPIPQSCCMFLVLTIRNSFLESDVINRTLSVSKQCREILFVCESSLGILLIVTWWLSQLSLFKFPLLFPDFPLIKRTLPWPVEHKIRYSIGFQPPLTAILSIQNSVALTQSCFQNANFPWLKHFLDPEEFFSPDHFLTCGSP